MSARVCLGAFAGAYGVKGAAKIRTFTHTERGVSAYGPVESEDRKRRFTLSFIRILRPGLAIISAPEIASREEAAALAGVRLYVPRSALPEASADEFYMEDLVGLAVVTARGEPAGRIVAVHNFGAGDVLEIADRPGQRGSIFAPFTKSAFPAIDLDRGVATATADAFLAEAAAEDTALVAEAMRQEDA
ncbi:MAG: ribosome maturation factor RimM [Parvularculaceae bacterium]|nr:ribosome maturation factor RimM [Parvularculaceae bacterium]